jgi:lipid-binding SYLF domain-containing protein
MKLFSEDSGRARCGQPPVHAGTGRDDEEATIEQSLIVLRDLQAISDSRIPDMLLARAEGIIILPANVKVGLWFGASFGSGVMLVRIRTAAGATRIRQDRRG